MALWSIFLSMFVAELGEKTQLTTLLSAADGQTRSWVLFLAASGALVLSTLIVLCRARANRSRTMFAVHCHHETRSF
jgi:putative Ca2+/H+ antiporter (TMEM165/GDT1 family)